MRGAQRRAADALGSARVSANAATAARSGRRPRRCRAPLTAAIDSAVGQQRPATSASPALHRQHRARPASTASAGRGRRPAAARPAARTRRPGGGDVLADAVADHRRRARRPSDRQSRASAYSTANRAGWVQRGLPASRLRPRRRVAPRSRSRRSRPEFGAQQRRRTRRRGRGRPARSRRARAPMPRVLRALAGEQERHPRRGDRRPRRRRAACGRASAAAASAAVGGDHARPGAGTARAARPQRVRDVGRGRCRACAVQVGGQPGHRGRPAPPRVRAETGSSVRRRGRSPVRRARPAPPRAPRGRWCRRCRTS